MSSVKRPNPSVTDGSTTVENVDQVTFAATGGSVTVTGSGRDATVTITGGGGAPTGAEYVVMSANGSLTNERVLTAGTGISIVDGGAGSTVTINSTASADLQVFELDLVTSQLAQPGGVWNYMDFSNPVWSETTDPTGHADITVVGSDILCQPGTYEVAYKATYKRTLGLGYFHQAIETSLDQITYTWYDANVNDLPGATVDETADTRGNTFILYITSPTYLRWGITANTTYDQVTGADIFGYNGTNRISVKKIRGA